MRCFSSQRLSLIACVCVVSAGAVVVAAPAKAPDAQKVFTKKDANSDGFLSLDEYKSGMKDKQLEKAEKRFKAIDTDADGKLSFEEFKAGMPKPKDS